MSAVDAMTISRDALRHWGGDPDSVEIVQVGVNVVSRFRDAGQAVRYLRLSHESHRSLRALAAELEFVEYLKAQQCDVAALIRSAACNAIEPLETPAGTFHAAVFEPVLGEKPRWGEDADNRRQLHERGKALGKIHRASKSFQPKLPTRFHWHEDSLFHTPDEFLPAGEPQLRAEFDRVTQFLREQPVTPDTYGMIHGDFTGTNCLHRDGRVYTFDFDDCCYHYFAFDLAVAIWAGRQLPPDYRRAYLQCLLDGYATENQLAATCETIGWFTRLTAIYRYTHSLRTGQIDQAEMSELRRLIQSPVRWC